MQSADAEGRNGGSPPTMEMADESAEEARPELPNANGHVKEETGVHHAAGGVDGGAVVAAAAGHGSRVELAVKIDMRLLHCPLCTLPFKPPVFQCDKGGHQACGGCAAQLPGGRCGTCGEDGGGFFHPCPALDAVVSLTKVGCPNAGCQTYVPYHEAADHRSACPHAPCDCTEPGCGFVGAPPRRPPLGAGAHHAVRPGQPAPGPGGVGAAAAAAAARRRGRRQRVPADRGRARRRRGRRVGGVRQGDRGNSCKMWVNLVQPASGGRADMVQVGVQVRSSTAPGAVVAADEPTFLAVPRAYMVGADGDAASMEVPLNIRIDKMPR